VWILELLFGISEIAFEIEYAKRVGWGNFWLFLGGMVCLLTAIDQFGDQHYILGIIATTGCIFCFVKLIIRTIEDIRSARDYAEWKQNQEKKKSEPQLNTD
jgi:hypothetical protein